MHVFVDTGPLVALLNRRDSFHTWCVEQASQLSPPFYTCEAVIAEAHFLLSRTTKGNRRLVELLSTERIILAPLAATQLKRVGELMLKYENVPMSFADACLVRMVEQDKGIIFTLDSDFRIYRKNRRQVLHLIIP